MAEWDSNGVYVPHFPYLLTRLLGRFHFLAIVIAAINMGNAYVSLNKWFYLPRIYKPNYEIAGSYGVLFLLSEEPHTVFHKCWADLHRHQWYARVPFAPHPCQPFFSFVFLVIANLTSVMWSLIVAFIRILLMIIDVGHSSCMCWSFVCLPLRIAYLNVLPIFSWAIWCFDIELFGFLNILVIGPLSHVQLASIFSHSVGFLFSLLILSFALQNLISFMKFHLSIFTSVCYALKVSSKKILTHFNVLKHFLYVFLQWSLSFMSLIHLEEIFVHKR